jgi:hypothetical protein
MPVRSLAAAMVRPRGSRSDDLILRAIAALALLGIVGSLLDPMLGALTSFVLYTLWTNGPYSAVLQGAYEPVLLLFGGMFPPLLIAALGTLATVFIEWVNYRLYAHARDSRAARSLTGGQVVQHVTRLFERAPFVAVALCALGIMPYTIARCLSVLSRYSVSRHLAATAVGRFPRLLAIAALGMTLSLPAWLVPAAVAFALAVASVIWFARHRLRPMPSVVSQRA